MVHQYKMLRYCHERIKRKKQNSATLHRNKEGELTEMINVFPGITDWTGSDGDNWA